MVIPLGYRTGRSPFPINADLVFYLPVPIDAITDPEVDESGNPIARLEPVQFGCYLLTGSRGGMREQVPGVEINRVFMRGRVIERVDSLGNRMAVNTLDPRIRAGLVADVFLYGAFTRLPDSLTQIQGKMQIEIPLQSAFVPVRSSLGDRFSGYFQQESISGNERV